MKTFSKKENYFLQSSIDFFQQNENSRKIFLKKFNYLYEEISDCLSNCINESKETIFFCCANYTISQKISSEKKFIHEVFQEHNSLDIGSQSIENFDHIVIADIEHQNNLSQNLLEISNKMSDQARVIVISKSLIWSLLIKIYKIFFSKNTPNKYNFLPFENLKSYLKNSNFEIIRNEKIIFFPFNIPVLKNIINTIFRFPILNFFCLINITVLKKKYIPQKEKKKISYIIPCKNEEGNILKFEDQIKKNEYDEFIFGNDKSSDQTKEEIFKLQKKYSNVKYYEGPGICKSENVYKGISLASGEVVLIYDADLTVKFSDLEVAIKLLNESNADMINCTRMIYPQKAQAMKKLNFFGNIMFAKFFSIIFNKNITDTLCGTKIFYKKDWNKIKKYLSFWGVKDYWGDFDLLLSAYKNNLKIVEVPVHYYERKSGNTKMINLISNTIRMLLIVLTGFYKLKIKNK